MTYSNGLAYTANENAQIPDAPDPEVSKKARRRYTAKFKQRILDQVDRMQPGETASFFRREGIYASMVRRWREERQQGSIEGSRASTEGPTVRKDAVVLQRRVQQLEKKLQQAETIMEVQKKLLLLFD